jgi:FlgD Ig-like domain/WD40-like Beta Propeller Repeat
MVFICSAGNHVFDFKEKMPRKLFFSVRPACRYEKKKYFKNYDNPCSNKCDKPCKLMRKFAKYSKVSIVIGNVSFGRIMKKTTVAFFGLFIFNTLYSQTLNVQGNIVAGTTPVKYASVTFIDQSDTTKKFTTNTDTLGIYHVSVLTSVDNKKFVLPSSVELAQNYPNPFSSSTAISYKINNQSDVNVTVYDILGREVKRFTVGMQAAGVYGVRWDGKDNYGARISSGVYFYRLQTKNETLVKKMIFTGSSVTINAPNLGGISSNQQILQKEETKQIVSGTYSVQVTNTDSTTPPVTVQKFSNINIHSDTTLNFQLSEANDFVICYEKQPYNNNWQIFLNNIKGTHPKDISNYAGDDEYPQWSPDGRYIVYSRALTLVAVYDVQNQTNTVLTSDTMEAGQNPFWTPNGKICFTLRGPSLTWGNYIMDPDGSNVREIKINPSYYGVSLFYQDSYTCLYVDSNKVYKTNLDSTFNEFILDLEPTQNQYIAITDFNPLTSELLLVGTNFTPDSSDAIAKFNVETKQLSILLTEEKSFSLGEQRYSKDFSKIVFIEISSNNTVEYLSILENGIKRRLVCISINETSGGSSYFGWYPLRFSPDDKYIAYNKLFMKSGTWITLFMDLYIVEIDTGNTQHIDNGEAYDWNPIKPQLYRRK